jgi:putative PEP-CTERM system integral membrane protein
MKSEFARLNDLALSKGIKHSDLIEEIHQSITSEYLKKYPQPPKDLRVVIDAVTGKVTLLSQNQDITPSEFAPVAEKIARQVILSQLEKTQALPPIKTKGRRKILSFLTKLIFFGYNSLFLILIAIFLIGLLGPEFRNSVIEALKKAGLYRSLFFFLLILVPPGTIIFAVKRRLRSARSLAKLFFLLEIPLIGLSLLFFSLGEITPVLWFFSLMLVFLPITLYSSQSQAEKARPPFLILNLGLHQAVLTSLVYLTFLAAFFIPPLVGGLTQGIGDFTSGLSLSSFISSLNFFSLIGLLFWFGIGSIIFTGVIIIILTPFLAILVIWKKFISLFRQAIQVFKSNRANLIIISLAGLYVITLALVSYQPDPSRIITQLEEAVSSQTFEARETLVKKLLPQKNKVRRALLDVTKARSRYLWIKGDKTLSESYRNIFKLDPAFCDQIQATFDLLAYPFVYQLKVGRHYQAADNYQYVFGEPLEDTQSKTKAKPNVNLVNRTISTQDGAIGLATITITEEYENTTFTNQEVIYEFSLPNEAVITKLRLGADLEFDGLIAPKGAAQRTYEAQIRQRRDPALLEQTGPRQYRLRVFPIPGKSDRTTLGGRNQKVEFTYLVTRNEDGFALPRYTKEQNIDLEGQGKITFLLNNRRLNLAKDSLFIDPQDNFDFNRPPQMGIQTTIGEDVASLIYHQNNPHLINKPPSDPKKIKNYLSHLKNLNLAIFYDASHQNDTQAIRQLKNTLNANPTFVRQNTVDFYFFNDLLSQARRLTPENLDQSLTVTNFGQARPFAVFSAFRKAYDLAIIITGWEEALTLSDSFPQQLRYPLYLIHAQEEIPSYHQQFSTHLLQNKGQVVDNLSQALNHFFLNEQLETSPRLTPLITSTYWSILLESKSTFEAPLANPFSLPTPPLPQTWPSITTGPTNPLSYLVAQNYLLTQFRNSSGDLLSNLALLDASHLFAEEAHIVTPYSSLLALVNQQQINELKRESQSSRRYQESALRTQPTPAPLFESSRGIFNPSFGALNKMGGGTDILQLNITPFNDAPSGQFTNGGGGFGPSLGFGLFPLGSLFFIANVLLLLAGTSVFLIFSLRKSKKSNEKQKH